jgi:hypothetical protein
MISALGWIVGRTGNILILTLLAVSVCAVALPKGSSTSAGSGTASITAVPFVAQVQGPSGVVPGSRDVVTGTSTIASELTSIARKTAVSASASKALGTRIALTAIIIAVAVAGVLMPLFRYVTTGWAAKRKDIMDGLGVEARVSYFKMFVPSDQVPRRDAAMKAFEDLYLQWYGRRFFIAPATLLAIVTLLATTLVVMSVLQKIGFLDSNPLLDLHWTEVAALAGAYLWVSNDLIARGRRLDLTPADVCWGALRFIIAVPMGYAFAAVASDSAGPFVAFALGAFPLSALTGALGRIATKKLDLSATPDEARDEIVKLQGINRAIVERLAAEDITTVTQMAYCDPVRLVMRSNLTFNFVTECMNQALAWLYFEEQLAVLRPLGVRGAVEIRCLIDEYDGAEGTVSHGRALLALPKIAAKLGQDVDTLQIAFRQIAHDPFTDFLSGVWG